MKPQLVCISALLFLAASCERLAADARYLLYPAATSGTIARYPLFVEFTADADEQMAFFGVDVSASHSDLTVQGTDYSAFAFQATSPLLDAWQPIPGASFGPGELKSTVEYETAASHLPAGRYPLGELLVDFRGTNLLVGNLDVIGLEAPDTAIGLEVPGRPETFHFVDVDVINVPEPSGWSMAIVSALTWIGARGARRRRNLPVHHDPAISLPA